MSTVNDGNTITAIRQAHDQVSTMLSHFSDPAATWDSFGKSPQYLEYLKVHLITLTHCVEGELQRQRAVEPQEFGT
jgi:hypothetical protein